MSVPARILRALIGTYRLTLSVLLGRHCRYLPTCSQYADESIARHGAWLGAWLTLARVLRCHPWSPSGFDPVPDLPPDAPAHPWRHARWTGRHLDPATRLDG